MIRNYQCIEYIENNFTVGVWIGQVDYNFKAEIDIEMIIEDISLMAYNHSPDCGDDYLEDVKEEHQQELQEELQKVLDKWIEKHNYHPNFFTIKNSFYYEVEGV